MSSRKFKGTPKKWKVTTPLKVTLDLEKIAQPKIKKSSSKNLYIYLLKKSRQGIEKCWRKLKNLFDLKKHHRDRGKFLDHFLFFDRDQRFDFYDRFIKNHLKLTY